MRISCFEHGECGERPRMVCRCCRRGRRIFPKDGRSGFRLRLSIRRRRWREVVYALLLLFPLLQL